MSHYLSKGILKGTCALWNSSEGRAIVAKTIFPSSATAMAVEFNFCPQEFFLYQHLSLHLQAPLARGIIFNIAKLFVNMLNPKVLW